MNPERWQNIIGNIKDNFAVLDEGHERIEDEGGIDIEYIVFKGPLGKMRLEYITKPLVIDKKTTYSRRIGSDTKVDYLYSNTEKSNKLLTYKWNEDDEHWAEVEAGNFS